MTELSFLVELLLNHKLQKSTKDIIAARLKEVEEGYGQRGAYVAPVKAQPIPPALVGQAPSTIAAMMRHASVETDQLPIPMKASQDDPLPVAVVAQTAATMAAMNSRQQAIGESMAGKVDKTTGRPRKW
jgi:hypothetical protein